MWSPDAFLANYIKPRNIWIREKGEQGVKKNKREKKRDKLTNYELLLQTEPKDEHLANKMPYLFIQYVHFMLRTDQITISCIVIGYLKG